MIVTSIYSIAEEIRSLLGNKFIVQEFISPVVDAYATIAKLSFYEGRQNDLSEIDGAYLYTFKGLKLNNDGKYYIDIPSTYLTLPHQGGISYVGFDNGGGDFAQIGVDWDLYDGLDCAVMGGKQVYRVEGMKMYFPKFTAATITTLDGLKTITLKLSVALDTTDVRTQINISPNIKKQIIDIVVKDYTIKPNVLPEKLEQ